MTATLVPYRRAAAGLAAVVACMVTGASVMQAQAESRLNGQYKISMTGVSIGRIDWFVEINEKRYVTSAQGKASGMLSMLVSGEGSVVAQGTIADDRAVPTSFISSITDDGGKSEVRMTLENGNVKDMIGPPPEASNRIPVSEADRRGVSDPLSAMLIPVVAGGSGPLSTTNCARTLAIFDGRRRYNLALSYKRVDKIALSYSYAGSVLVCGVILQPIAGYRSDSMLVKYVAGRRDLELWFAPIGGTSFIAPIRVVMPTLLGTLEIAAERFDSVPIPAAVAPLSPTASPQ